MTLIQILTTPFAWYMVALVICSILVYRSEHKGVHYLADEDSDYALKRGRSL